MKQGNHNVSSDKEPWHLLKLVQSSKKSPLEYRSHLKGLQSVRGYFYPYLYTVVALDHVVTGISKCLIEFFFLQLNDNVKQNS